MCEEPEEVEKPLLKCRLDHIKSNHSDQTNVVKSSFCVRPPESGGPRFTSRGNDEIQASETRIDSTKKHPAPSAETISGFTWNAEGMFLFIKSKPEHGGWCSHSRVIKMLPPREKKADFINEFTDEGDYKEFRQSEQAETERFTSSLAELSQNYRRSVCLQVSSGFTCTWAFTPPQSQQHIQLPCRHRETTRMASFLWNHQPPWKHAAKAAWFFLRRVGVLFAPVFTRSRCRREMYWDGFLLVIMIRRGSSLCAVNAAAFHNKTQLLSEHFTPNVLIIWENLKFIQCFPSSSAYATDN